MAFQREIDLLETALDSADFQELFAAVAWPIVLKEPRGLFGIPDAVFTTIDLHEGNLVYGTTTAFEMKLRNWKRALAQAFRYRLFAHAAYVVLDAAHAAPAIKNLDCFRRSHVGLITICESGNIQVHYKPECELLICERMIEKFMQAIMKYLDAM